ncbi:palmitoyltransferase ZDHHC2-like [Arapaima gigas]
MMFLFFAAAMFSISLSSLFSYHCWLVCKNRSTLGKTPPSCPRRIHPAKQDMLLRGFPHLTPAACTASPALCTGPGVTTRTEELGPNWAVPVYQGGASAGGTAP